MNNKKLAVTNDVAVSPFIRLGKQIYVEPKEAKVKSLHLSHPLEFGWNGFLKRTFDVIFASFAILFVLSWLIPVLGIMILLDSGWPIFFVQHRHGRNSELFPCIKFRTMVKNDESHSRQAKAGDERITRLGRIMRRYNLDELPQFINVLLGHMSIVGPRPHMKSHTLEYEQQIGYYRERLLVKPGITGLAQAQGNHGPTPTLVDMKHRVDYDIFYIKRWTLMLDIRLIMGTFVNIFTSSFHK